MKTTRKQIMTLVCPHCRKNIILATETAQRVQRRALHKASRCKYYGSGLEYMPPKGREEALADIMEMLEVDEVKADGIRSTLQRAGIWSFDHADKTYTGIKWAMDKEVE